MKKTKGIIFWITKIRRKYIEVEWEDICGRWWGEIRKSDIREKHWPLLQIGTYLVLEPRNKLFHPLIKRWTKKELEEAKREAEETIKLFSQKGGLFNDDQEEK